MRFNILIGGKAGFGINETANILTRALAKQGFYVFNYRDYPSLVRGGHNFNVVCVSDEKIGSFDKKIDLVLALDQKTIDTHEKNFKKDAKIPSC